MEKHLYEYIEEPSYIHIHHTRLSTITLNNEKLLNINLYNTELNIILSITSSIVVILKKNNLKLIPTLKISKIFLKAKRKMIKKNTKNKKSLANYWKNNYSEICKHNFYLFYELKIVKYINVIFDIFYPDDYFLLLIDTFNQIIEKKESSLMEEYNNYFDNILNKYNNKISKIICEDNFDSLILQETENVFNESIGGCTLMEKLDEFCDNYEEEKEEVSSNNEKTIKIIFGDNSDD